MAFFLTGGGEQGNFRQLDKKFLESLPRGSRVAVLPHASEDYQEAFGRVEEEFQHRNVAEFACVLEPNESLLDFDAIMIEGGNTFELIHQMRQSSFFNLLKRFADSGKAIYADSAGAIILGADVETAFLGEDGDDDAIRMQDYRGCDLLGGWSVHAHATYDENEALTDLLYNKGNPILALPEECGIVLEDGSVEVFGGESLSLVTFEGVELLSPSGRKLLF